MSIVSQPLPIKAADERGVRRKNVARAIVLGMVGLAIVLYLYVALSTITYPYELEWMEGGSVDAVTRVLQGLPIHAAPTPEWVGPLYAPVYFWVSALFALVIGNGFLTLRLVSLIASLVICWLIYHFIQRETRQTFPAWIGVGIFCGAFAVGGAWYHLARVDTLFVMWLLACAYVVRYSATRRGYLGAAVLAALAFQTKQSAAAPLLALAVYSLFMDWRRALWFIIPAGLLVGGSVLALEWSTNGWYSHYALKLGNGTYGGLFVPSRLLTFWTSDLSPLVLAGAAGVIFFVVTARRRNWPTLTFFALLTLSFLASAYAGRLIEGGYLNAILPMIAMLALLAGLGVASTFELIHKSHFRRKGWLSGYAYLLIALQFLALLYNPNHYIPTAEDREAGAALIALLRAQPGDVLVVGHGYYADMAGKPGYHFGFGSNVTDGLGDHPQKRALVALVEQGITEQRWSAIITDDFERLSEPFADVLDQYYVSHSITYPDDYTFRPVTGMGTRPTEIWTPR
ncbi:MAG: glycosyltransferase family 39 protein [Anaerolineae bacterium]|nr:glycosyltransferase family 39 protein [Anaerolineae bacterium]